MSSNIDPITGLPDGYVDPLSYQIPLNSQPVLAPEWQPQGKIPQTLFPDNIPTFFATLQAMNGSNPSVVQALRTHPDTQAVEVYDLASGGSSGGGVVATKTFETSWGLHTLAIKSPLTINRLCSVLFTAGLDMPAPTSQRNGDVSLYLAPTNATLPRVRIAWAQMVVGLDLDNPLKGWVEFNHDYTNPLDPCTMLGLPEGTPLALYGYSAVPGDGTMYIALHYA